MKKFSRIDWCAMFVLLIGGSVLSKWLINSSLFTHRWNQVVIEKMIEPLLHGTFWVMSSWFWVKLRDLQIVTDTGWAEWSNIHQRGFWHYVFVGWVINFGFLLAAIFTPIIWVLNAICGKLTFDLFIQSLFFFVLSPFLGLLVGLATWNVTENQYSKWVKQRPKPN